MRLIVLLVWMALTGFAPSLQQQYNAAHAAFEAGDFATASREFAAILANPGTLARVSQGEIGIELGDAYVELDRLADARAAYAQAAETLRQAAPAGREARIVALSKLGVTDERRGDLDGAAAAFQQVVALDEAAGNKTSLGARGAVARTVLFKDPALARSMLDGGMAAAELQWKDQSDNLAGYYLLRGRIELNHGNPKLAQQWAEKALKAAGGLGLRVNLVDRQVRSDLAIIMHLLGRPVDMRRYLAYTGAGQMNDADFRAPNYLVVPVCGISDVKPDDAVILELSIDSKGRALAPQVIWSSRPAAIEQPFVVAAGTSIWPPDEVKDMGPFWRAGIRVEMRCGASLAVAASGEPEPPGVPPRCDALGALTVSGSPKPSDYPQEALRWGFSGWATVQGDLGGDGWRMQPRVIAAYPPFVFGPVTQQVVSRMKFAMDAAPQGCRSKGATILWQAVR